jgi:transcriptional regulator with XRE-family HTH domain
MAEEITPIGERLRMLRRWRGMTLAELAGLAGVTTSAVSMWERGQRPLDRRSSISALAAALRVSEQELTGGPHLGADPLQSGPHQAVPALREAFAVNTVGRPATDRARPLGEISADLAALRPAYAAYDYVRQGAVLAGLLHELYALISESADEAARVSAARVLVEVCSWSAWMCHALRCHDLAQIAARAAVEAANLTGDPVEAGKAQFPRTGTAPRSWQHSLALAEHAASDLEPHVRDERGFQVLGMLTLRCALEAAAAGNGGHAAHWLDEAQALADRVDDEDPARNWEWFGATNVAVWRVAIAVEQGVSGRAVLELAKQANPAKLLPNRRAALCADVARGLARERATQPEAVRWLHRADTAAPQYIRNYAPARETVAFLLSRARVAAGGRELRGLAARMGIPHAEIPG